MARVKIVIPDTAPLYKCSLQIRINEVNYGGHLGNDAVLGLAHEARVRMLRSWEMTELDVGGCGIIMADAAIIYQSEGFAGDVLSIEIYLGDVGSASCELIYVLKTEKASKNISIAIVKTGLVCYDYTHKIVAKMPEALIHKLQPMSE